MCLIMIYTKPNKTVSRMHIAFLQAVNEIGAWLFTSSLPLFHTHSVDNSNGFAGRKPESEPGAYGIFARNSLELMNIG